MSRKIDCDKVPFFAIPGFSTFSTAIFFRNFCKLQKRALCHSRFSVTSHVTKFCPRATTSLLNRQPTGRANRQSQQSPPQTEPTQPEPTQTEPTQPEPTQQSQPTEPTQQSQPTEPTHTVCDIRCHGKSTVTKCPFSSFAKVSKKKSLSKKVEKPGIAKKGTLSQSIFRDIDCHKVLSQDNLLVPPTTAL